jgi:hypothetical protein
VAEALPVVESCVHYVRDLAGSSSQRGHHAEAVALARRLIGLVQGLPRDAALPFLDRLLPRFGVTHGEPGAITAAFAAAREAVSARSV